MSRAVAEMIPAVTLPPRPKGLPIAKTQSPTRVLLESPQVAAGNGILASTLRSAKSVTGSRPMTCACNVVSSDNVTVIWSAVAMTWLLVTIRPDGSMMRPDPSDATRPRFGAPGVPLAPKKSRKKSSSDGAGGFCGTSCAFLAGAGGRVAILTTTPTRRPDRRANTSAKGESGTCARLGARFSEGCGRPGAVASDGCAGLDPALSGLCTRSGAAGSRGCAQPDAAPPASNANDTASTVPRRPTTLTAILPLPLLRPIPHLLETRSGPWSRRCPGSGTGLFRHARYEMAPREWQDRIERRSDGKDFTPQRF